MRRLPEHPRQIGTMTTEQLNRTVINASSSDYQRLIFSGSMRGDYEQSKIPQ
jgi:hypothetical protein